MFVSKPSFSAFLSPKLQSSSHYVPYSKNHDCYFLTVPSTFRFQQWKAKAASQVSDRKYNVQIGPFSSLKALKLDYVVGDCGLDSAMAQSSYQGDMKVTADLLRLW